MAIKAIETKWKGYRFRSRLEARWAVFFDALGLRWRYEPEGYDLGGGAWYLPDFFIEGNGHRGPYIEIKGAAPSKAEIEKMETLCEGLGAYGAILFGEIGANGWISIHKEVGRDFDEQHNAFNGLYPLCRYSDEQIADAVNAARAARFERGEVPA